MYHATGAYLLDECKSGMIARSRVRLQGCFLRDIGVQLTCNVAYELRGQYQKKSPVQI